MGSFQKPLVVCKKAGKKKISRLIIVNFNGKPQNCPVLWRKATC